jgi:transposase-like protein
MARTRAVSEKDLIGKLPGAVEVKGLSREEVLGEGGLLKQLTVRLLNRILEAETGGHLVYERNSNAGDNSGDSRNGHSEKTILTENQSAVIKVPRDRNGTFEPKIIPKYEKRVPLFNRRIISMYGFGMSDRDIKARLEQVYNVEVSPELISRVTGAVMDDVVEWRSRPLDKGYAVAYLDALRVNARQEGKGRVKSVYAAVGVNFEGKKDVLGRGLKSHG